MEIRELLLLPAMSGCRLIAGSAGSDRLITGVNIVESADLEVWGRKGLLLLSSYYALEHMSESELQEFVATCAKLEISGLVIKLDRLIKVVSPLLVKLCEKYRLPLIEIDHRHRYEAIMLQVLSPIIMSQSSLLKTYYEMDNVLVGMQLRLDQIKEIMRVIRDFINIELTLLEGENKVVSTTLSRFEYRHYRDLIHLTRGEILIYDCSIAKMQDNKWPDFLIEIPEIEGGNFTLILHQVSPERIPRISILIEKAVRTLQITLLRDKLSNNRRYLDTNMIVRDLIYNILDHQTIDLYLNSRNITERSFYLLSVNLLNNRERSQVNKPKLEALLSGIHKLHPNCLYYVGSYYFTLLLAPQGDLQTFKENVNALLEQISENKQADFLAVLSDEHHVSELKNAQFMNIRLLKLAKNLTYHNQILDYSELGYLKLLLHMENNMPLTELVDPLTHRLYREDYELFDTLLSYYKNKRSLMQTAEDRFIHPKTVKYRIQKIVSKYNIDPEDSTFMLKFLLSAQLILLL